MFGKLEVTKMIECSKRETLESAAARLLEFTEYPKVVRWFQFPTALVVFLAHDDALDSGAIYVYDRKRCAWLWVDFNDQNYGGYSASECDLLINQCHFFRIAELPRLLESPVKWFVSPGQMPTVLERPQA